MQVQQAIFTSLRDGRVRGYQLAARSPGVDDRTGQTLTKWGPSHAALCGAQADAESYNFHPIDDELFALSRTMYGGPEYSERGGLQMVTRYALLNRRQLEGFDNDAVALIRLARTEGGFQFENRFETRLPEIKLSDASRSAFWLSTLAEGDLAIVEGVVERLGHGKRLAVTNCRDPLALLQHVLHRIPIPQRLDVSFTTGLKPTAHRPFHLHFLPDDSADLRRSTAALGLTCLAATG
ncbi:MAG: hypothetical protein ACE5KM_02255 [Planctomycetaceae bacterium]